MLKAMLKEIAKAMLKPKLKAMLKAMLTPMLEGTLGVLGNPRLGAISKAIMKRKPWFLRVPWGTRPRTPSIGPSVLVEEEPLQEKAGWGITNQQ